jgi:hypothetical protein
MVARLLLLACCALAFGLTACGGGPKAQTADLVAIHQPTPDPTLDAVVRDLPRALAGVEPTATPVPKPVVVPKPAAPAPKVAAPTQKPAAPAPKPAAPTQVPAPPKPTATPTRR